MLPYQGTIGFSKTWTPGRGKFATIPGSPFNGTRNSMFYTALLAALLASPHLTTHRPDEA